VLVKRVLVFCVLALFGVAMTASPCWACSCLALSKKQYADQADVVFYGKVVHIDGSDTDGGVSGPSDDKVKVWVQTVYKGKIVKRTVTVGTAYMGCGYVFEKGERYTVFAMRDKGRLKTYGCMGTKEGNINPDNYGLSIGRKP
jgi:hypothetical protein